MPTVESVDPVDGNVALFDSLHGMQGDPKIVKFEIMRKVRDLPLAEVEQVELGIVEHDL